MFEKYKRPLFLALTLFALVTFSITGAIYAYVAHLAAPKPGSILLPRGEGRKEVLSLTEEDVLVGRNLARLHGILAGRTRWNGFVFLDLSDRWTESPELVFAILRRVALERGIDVSDDEVQRAAEVLSRESKMSPLQFARSFSLGDESTLRAYLREALRISFLVRLEVLAGTDLSLPALAETIAKKRERITLSYAAFPAAPIEETLKASPPKDDDLRAWLAGLSKEDLVRYQLADDVHVRFDGVGLLVAEARLEDFAEELKDYQDPSEEQLRSRYELDRDRLYVRPGWKEDGASGGDEDGAPLAASPAPAGRPGPATKRAGQSTQGPATKQARPPDQRPASAPSGGGGAPPSAAQAETKGAHAASKPAPVTVPTREQAKYRPFEEVKDDVLRRMKLEAALEKLLQKARRAAEKAATSPQGKKDGAGKKTSFDLKAWLAAEAKGRRGLIYLAPMGPAAPESFKSIPSLGSWTTNWVLRSSGEAGNFGSSIQQAEKGFFFYRILERKKDVLKPFEKIRKEAVETWAKLEAMKRVKDAAERFVKRIHDEAEKLNADPVGKVRSEIERRAGEKLAAWKKDLEAKIARADRLLKEGGIPGRARPQYEKKIAEWRAQLAKAGEKLAAFKKEIEKDAAGDLEEALGPKLAEAFDRARAALKPKVENLGPVFTDADRDPLFALSYGDAERFLLGRSEVKELAEGRVTGVLVDETGRAAYVCRMDHREPGGAAAVDRRHLLLEASAFARERLRAVLENSYNFKALKARFAFKSGT